jgi:hypothetical protein
VKKMMRPKGKAPDVAVSEANVTNLVDAIGSESTGYGVGSDLGFGG